MPPRPCLPSPLLPPPPALPTLDPALASAVLAAFCEARAQLEAWAAFASSRGAPLPLPPALQQLQRASPAAWRELCFGVPAPAPSAEGSGGGGECQTWCAEGEGAAGEGEGVEEWEEWEEGVGGEEWEGEEEGEAGMLVGGEEEEEEEQDAAALAEPSPPPSLPLAPTLSTIFALDHLAILRALRRTVSHLVAAREAAPQQPLLPPAEAAWLYALLCALHTPLLAATSATLRELFLLLRAHQADAAAQGGGAEASTAATIALCIITGRFFGAALATEL